MNKTQTIAFKVSQIEKRNLQEAATREGLTLSAWIRFIALKEIVRKEKG